MRLNELEVAALLDACVKQGANTPFKLHLFGSRLNDNLKGGDIDLLLLVEDPVLHAWQLRKHYIVAAIKSAIGDQKVDFIITSPELLKRDEFHAYVATTMQLIG